MRNEEEKHRWVVVTIFCFSVGVAIILLLMTVWNPKVQAVFEENREVEKSTEFNPDPYYCNKSICLDDLSKPEIYRRLR